MCTTVLVTFASSAAEGLTAGVLQNYRLNDRQREQETGIDNPSALNNPTEDTQVLLLVNTERNAVNDFYIFDPEDVIYEEFNEDSDFNINYTFFGNDSDDGEFPPELVWRSYRPAAYQWLYICFKISFYIAVLSSLLVGGFCAFIMFIDINTADICSSTEWVDVPITVQRIRVTVQTIEGWLLEFFHIFTMLFTFKWELIGSLHLMNWNLCAAFTDAVYRLYLQVYNKYDFSWKSIPLNVIFVGIMLFNSFRIARHFYHERKKIIVLTFQLGSQFILGAFVVYATVYLLIPWFNTLSEIQQAIVAAISPINGAIAKAISRVAIQSITGINHPGTSYILVIAPYAASAIIYRTLQAEIETFKYFAALCIAHGLVGLLERLSVVLRDHFYVWFYKKVLKRHDFQSYVGIFRTPRTQRLIADLTICNIIHEVTALVYTNAFVQLYALQFGVTKGGVKYRTSDILFEFFTRTTLAISSEFIFTVFGIFILTWYLNIPVVRVWRRKWKSLVFANMAICGILVVYSTQYLVSVVDSKYKNRLDINDTANACTESELLFFR